MYVVHCWMLILLDRHKNEFRSCGSSYLLNTRYKKYLQTQLLDAFETLQGTYRVPSTLVYQTKSTLKKFSTKLSSDCCIVIYVSTV
jgi:hypothetical protein